MTTYLLLFSAVFATLVLAVSAWILHGPKEEPSGLLPLSETVSLGDSYVLKRLLESMMLQPGNDRPITPVLTSTLKLCDSQPRGAMQVAWMTLAVCLEQSISRDRSGVQLADVSHQPSLIWRGDPAFVAKAQAVLQSDFYLLDLLSEIHDLIIKYPLSEFNSTHATRYIQLASGLLEKIQPKASLNPF